MGLGGRFARRLAVAMAVFELSASLGTGSLLLSSFWRSVFLFAAPFAIYGLALGLGARLFEARAARAAGVAAYLLLGVSFFWRHHFVPISEAAAVTIGVFLLGGVALLHLPVRVERGLRWLPLSAAVIAGIGLFMWLREENVPWRGLPPEADAPVGAPNLVLVSWDTVRADVLDLYGGSGAPTPNLSQLAAEGIVCEDAVAVASITGPSHASMLTGRYPPVHGMRSNGATGLDDAIPTLPEMLSEAGYHTGGFVSAYPVLGKFGFARGFEIYDDRLPASGAVLLSKLGRRNFLWLQLASLVLPSAPDASISAEQVNERVGDWLAGLAELEEEDPFFLFVHYYDAHGPFTPEDPWRTAALEAAPLARPQAVDPTVEDEMTLYRAEISQLDAQFGALREMLERQDPGLENTLILLTSDHGECFGEGGIVLNHTASLHEATQHVPMVLRWPDAAGAGARIRATATHLDVLPTLLRAASIAPSADFAGPGIPLQELRPPEGKRRQVYMEAQQRHLGAERKIGWRTGFRKLVRWTDGREELWGFAVGETEGVDRSSVEAEIAALLRTALDVFLDGIEPSLGEFVELGAEDARALDALGYAGD